MRIFIFFLCTSVFSLTPNSIVSQNAKISIDTDKAITVDEVFELIANQTDYKFIYQSDLFKDFPKVDLKKGVIKVNKLLEKSLSGGDFNIKLEDANTIVIEEKPIQDIVVTGLVTDPKGGPLAGVTVLIDGANRGATTDYDGKFSIRVTKETGVLIFSSIGYKSRRVNYVAGTPLTVKMEEELSALDEVTIVAYGNTSKRKTAGSVSTVKAEDIKDIPSSSIANLLQGRLSGVSITNNSGAPGGGGSNIVVRGFNSLGVEAGRRFSNPLWVVDGVPISSFTSPVTGTNGLADLNPEVIETVTVLKDAAATALYGARAANGVIVVTTKKGKKNQKGRFDVNYSESISVLPEYPVITGGNAERNFRLNGVKNQGTAYFDSALNDWVYPDSHENAWGTLGLYDGNWGNGSVNELKDGTFFQDSLNAFGNNSTNFYRKLYRKAKVRNANIQTYGGGENMSYSIGLGYYDEEGIVIGTGFKRVSLLGNFSVKPIKKLSINLNNYLSTSDRSRGNRSGGLSSGQELELIPGEAIKLSTLLPLGNNATNAALESFRTQSEKNVSYRLRSSIQFHYNVFEGLDLRNTTSIDFSQNNRNVFLPAVFSVYNETNSKGELQRNITSLNETVLNYNKTFNEKHNFDLTLGLSFQNDVQHYIGGSANGGPGDLVHYVGRRGWPDVVSRDEFSTIAQKNYRSDFTESKLNSVFGRLNYSLDGKYIATATVRRDGSSVFGSNVRWATFPSVGLAWNFSEESFVKALDFLDFGKLRASYGLSGNTFSNPYLAYGVLEAGFPHRGLATTGPNYSDGFYNPNLSWEETRQLDLGFDLQFFKNRLEITTDYYRRETKDLLYKVTLPGDYSGYALQWINAASVSNQGLEFEFKYDVIRNDKAYWRMSFNVAKNINTFSESYNNRDITDFSEKRFFVLGREINSIYGLKTDGFYQTEDEIPQFFNSNGQVNRPSRAFSQGHHARPGDIKFVDVNGDNIIDFNDQVYLGSTLPDITGGFINEIKWKNFDLNMLFTFALGRDMVNLGPQLQVLQRDAPLFWDLTNTTFWEQAGDNPDQPIYRKDAFNFNFTSTHDRNIETVNYAKLKTLTIGYTLPKAVFKSTFSGSIRFFFSGENLLLFTNYSGLDPEVVDIRNGIDNGKAFPLARKLTLGLTIKL